MKNRGRKLILETFVPIGNRTFGLVTEERNKQQYTHITPVQISNAMASASMDIPELVRSRSIFKTTIPPGTVFGPVRDSPRFCFTTRNGTRLVQLRQNTLRWGSVASDEFKSMQLNAGDYENAILSPSGNYLCLYGPHSFRVVEIPWGYSKISDSLRTSLQGIPYTFEESATIKQLLFHPRASNDSCLVVLFSDDTICLYDLPTETELMLNKPSRTLGLNTRVSNIASICFSQDGLSLYLLSTTDGGDIYTLYPCLPSKLSLSKGQLEDLLYRSIILYNTLGEDGASEADAKRNIIRQLQFVSSLNLDNGKTKGTKEGIQNSDDACVVREIESEYRIVKPQGPFTIAPFPEELYSATANDIFTVSMGGDKCTNELVIVSYTNGNVVILLRDLEPSMSWDVNGYVYNNSMVLVESMKLQGVTVDSDIRFVRNYSETNQFMVQLPQGILRCFDMTSWSDIVLKCLESADLTMLPGTEFKSTQVFSFGVEDEKIDTTKKMSKTSEYKFCGKWRLKGHEGILLYSERDILTRNIRALTDVKTTGNSGGDDNSAKQQLREKPQKNFVYKTEFSQPLEEILNTNQAFMDICRQPFKKAIPAQDRRLTLSNESNERQLGILTDISRDLVSHISLAQSLGIAFHRRILEQQDELVRQLSYGNDMLLKLARIQRQYSLLTKRWEDRKARQQSLEERLSKLGEKLCELRDSPRFKGLAISNSEIKWFKEVRSQVLTFNELIYKQQALQEEFGFVKKELSRLKDLPENVEEDSYSEWVELQRILEADNKIMVECQKGLSEVHNALDSRITSTQASS